MKRKYINVPHYVRFDDETGELFLSDSRGYILSIRETKEVIEGLQLLVQTTSEEEITKINEQIEFDKRKALYENYMSPQNNQVKPREKLLFSGYIYFVQDDQGRVKIGKTKKLKDRLGEYTKLPFEPKLIHVFKSDDYHNTEIAIHKYFQEKRIRGEWFALTAQDIKSIQEGLLDNIGK